MNYPHDTMDFARRTIPGPEPRSGQAPMGAAPTPYETGMLPSEGMLANTYVPFQRPGSRKFSEREGLKKGTLFPGLDLPYRNFIATREVANTPMGELMALGFAIGELGLYLDTHPDDREALELHNSYVRMYQEAVQKFEAQYGPIRQATVMEDKYTWLKNPWPWERQ